MNTRIRPACLILGIFLTLAMISPLQAQSRDLQTWMKGVRAGSERAWDGKADPADFWLEGIPDFALNILLKEHEAGAPDEEIRRSIEYIVSQFGRDAYTDFRLFRLCDEMMDPLQLPNWNRTSEDLKKGGKRSELLDRIVEWFAEAQINDWKSHPEKVERVVWFRAWRRSQRADYLFLPGTHANMAKDDPNASVRRRWQIQRMLMYLQCMTGCQNSYIGKTDLQIRASHKDWKKYVWDALKGGRLRASGCAPIWVVQPEDGKKRIPHFEWPKLKLVPRTPFPDWPKSLPVPEHDDIF